MNFYSRLLSLCQSNDIKITSLLTELGLSKGNLTNWKKGTIPNGDVLIKLAQYFKVSVDYLLGQTEHKHKTTSLDNIGNLSIDYPNELIEVPIEISFSEDKLKNFFLSPETFYSVIDNIKNIAAKSGVHIDDISQKQKDEFKDIASQLNPNEKILVCNYMKFILSQRAKDEENNK